MKLLGDTHELAKGKAKKNLAAEKSPRGKQQEEEALKIKPHEAEE